MTTITENQEAPEKEFRLLSSDERAVFSQIAAKEPPHSQRAQALLVVDEGATQAEAGRQSGLAIGQVRYWLGKFRKDGTTIFPEELMGQAQPEDPGEDEVQGEMPDAEETAGTVDEAVTQQEGAPKAKMKPKKKAKKKSKKAKKSKKMKKPKQAKKKKKGKKSNKHSKKNVSKKVKAKSGKKNKKKRKK